MTFLLVALVLAQDPAAEPPAEPAAAPAAEAPAAAAPAPGVEATPKPAGSAPAPAQPALWNPGPSRAAEEAAGLMKKYQAADPADRMKIVEDFKKKFPEPNIVNPVLPPNDFEWSKYSELPNESQVLVTARHFFLDLLNGDAAGVVAHAGLPFLLEDKRYDRADELRNEWARALRRKRTDLLTLYDVEVLTPADMEKKYGKAPQRLSGWPLRSPNTFVAVGNLSGHATVLLMRQSGAAWQVVAYHD